jgi:hypothetical protein
VTSAHSKLSYEVQDVGLMYPEQHPAERLYAGQVRTRDRQQHSLCYGGRWGRGWGRALPWPAQLYYLPPPSPFFFLALPVVGRLCRLWD